MATETRKIPYRSLAARISFWILASSASLFLVVLSTNFFLARQLLEEYVKDLAISTVGAAVRNIESVLGSVSISAESLAALVADHAIDDQHAKQSIRAMMDTNSNVFGMTIALEPGMVDGSVAGFAPYYYRSGNGLAYADLSDRSYRYRTWDWYQRPLEAGTGVWSEPYLDKGGGNTQMTTYSTPIRRGDAIIGVATADVELKWLHELVANIHIGETGYGFIVSRDDRIVSHPNTAMNMKPLLETLDDEVIPENWQKYLESKQSDDTVYLYTPCGHIEDFCYVAIESLADTGWKILIVVPESEIVADIRELTVVNAAVAAAGLALLLAIVTVVAGKLTRPLSSLAEATRNIGRGDLDIALPKPPYRDEIGSLAADFDNMRIALKDHIERVRVATASQQKLESEIEIAKEIQMSMIPGAGNIDFQEPNLDLFAFLRPARSVGGDLYYFSLADNRLKFIIGDVSDKGVAAALFMARAVTLYTRALRDDLSPAETFAMMNDLLSEDNDACMFVTALCGDFDLENGKLVMANAGHMNPLVANNSGVAELAVAGAAPLGLRPGVVYSDNSSELANGSTLLAYTDGITEAKDDRDSDYGDPRLASLFRNKRQISPRELGAAIIEDVDDFAGDCEQFDDMTLFVIRYK